MLLSQSIGVKIAELPGWQCGETGPRPAQPHWAQANVKVVLLIPATCHVAELQQDTWTLVQYSLGISPMEAYLSLVGWISIILTVSARLSPRYFSRYSAYPRDQSPLSSPDPEHCQYRESGVWELFPATKHHNITHLPCQHSPHLPFNKIVYIIVFHFRYDQAGTAWPCCRW